MELPHLGVHCSEPTCKKLGKTFKFYIKTKNLLIREKSNIYFCITTDFLPVKCDGCNKVFW